MESSYLSIREDQALSERFIPRSNSTSNLFALSSTFSKLNVRNEADCNYLGPNKKRHIYGGVASYGSMTGAKNFPTRSSSMTAAQHRKKTALLTARERSSYHEGLNEEYDYQHPSKPQNTVRMYRKLTPYQIQRSRMKTSFQFPNGEVYKPKLEGRNSSSLKRASLDSKSSFLFRFGERNDNSPSEYSPTSSNTAQTPPISNFDQDHDTNSLNSYNSITSTAKSSLALSFPISIVNTPSSFTESLTDDDDGYENKTVTISYDFQTTAAESHTSPIKKLNLSSEDNMKPPTKSRASNGKRKTITGNDKNKKCKKSSSRLNLGSVLKKFWSKSENSNTKCSKKYKKRIKNTTDDTATHSEEISHIEDSDIDYMDINLDSIEIDDDETLMDANSIFDDLLSKENNKYDSRRKQLEIRQKLQETTANDNSENSCGDMKEDSADVMIDETLIEDFSKLGEFIIDTRNQPPPRSSKRPSLDNNLSARHFYSVPTNLRQSLLGPISLPMNVGGEIVNRLRNDWEYIRFEDWGCSSSNSSLSNTGAVSKPTKKGVRFAQEVCLASTWSSNTYERANPEFIMNRHRLLWMMKINPSMNTAMNEVKFELNSYKRNEMVVHENSKCFTHYLI
ncbi:afr1p [Saccharomyces arboricola H-6]|uniref:Afr1p n=1 Tax=Saccharomyces arboricola (strain H-6 / AS 2.3317 / CBS 10644) TaxID=1160507 RepID=J8Q6P0_SACAR|nr:afr1p [Saccharomyces arboricola H-6]